MSESPSLQIATFAAGCFWGVEKSFSELKGVLETLVGYTGGVTDNPSYEEVCAGKTGHAEAVQISFDSSIIDYKALVNYFFSIHDPTELNKQGPDIGTQYRSCIFAHTPMQALQAIEVLQGVASDYDKPIATEIVEAGEFFPAEDYHQKYFLKK